MPEHDFTIRAMTRDELDLAVDWAASEGWNPGLHDADSFYAADPAGFLICLDGDEPVGCISAVKYGETYGFIGFYIVKPEHRGGPYGVPLGDAALARLKGRCIGLDGVVAKQSYYGKCGFLYAHRNVRYQTKGGAEILDDSQLVPLTEVPFSTLSAYDRQLFPEERETFLRAWITQQDSYAVGFMDGDTLKGYGVIRPCREGYKIGPLFADHPDIAETLYRALSAQATDRDTVYLDAPETNEFAVALAELRNMQVVFETARMYIGGAPELPIDRIYGITTYELG